MAWPWPLSLLTRAPAPAAPDPAPDEDDRFDEDGLPLGPIERAHRADGWRDLYAGHGTDRDPRMMVDYVADLVSDDQAIELLRGSAVARKIARKIVDEGMRPGIELEVAERDQLRNQAGEAGGTDETPAAQRKRDVEAEWRRLGMWQAIKRAAIWERARGGAAILLGLTDFRTMPHEQAAEGARLEWLRVVASRDLTPDRWYTDPRAEKFGQVEVWRLNATSKGGGASVEPEMLVHESRLIIFGGERVTDDLLPGQLAGWGDSVFVLVKAAIRRFDAALDGIELLVRRHGEPWWGVKDLAVLLGRDKGGGFRDLLNAHERARSQLKLRVVDADDKFGMTAAPLAGIREIVEVYERELAAAGDMPATELFGDTPGGIGDGNVGPRKTWEATAFAWATEHVIDPAERITRIIMAGLGGEPVEWKLKQRPHSQMSAKEEAELRKLDADTDVALVGATVITARDAARRSEIQMRYQLEQTEPVDGLAPADIRDLVPDPNDPAQGDPPADPGVTVDGKSTEVQATALNGAQVAALLAIIGQVARGEISRESGTEAIMFSFQLPDRARAERMLGPVGWSAAPKSTPPAFDQPPDAKPTPPEAP